MGIPSGVLATGISLIEGAYPAKGDPIAALDAFSAESGSFPSSFSLWSSWSQEGRSPRGREFPSPEVMSALESRNVAPVIFWEPDGEDDLDKIIAGHHDAYLRRWATEASKYDYPIFVRFAHEMNAPWFPWGGRPVKYRQAWRRMYGIVKSIAPNLRLIFCPWNSDSAYRMEDYFPGVRLIDRFGIDGYQWVNWAGASMVQLFNPMLARMGVLSSHKVFICETGISDGGTAYGRNKWLKDGYAALLTKAQVTGILYFDINMRDVTGPSDEDWRLDANPSVMDTYKSLVSNPAFQVRLA